MRDVRQRVRSQRRGVKRVRGLALVGALALAVGCAPMQVVMVNVEPTPLTVYLDGEPLPDQAPREIELRADRPHLLFFKKRGYRAEQVVIHSRLVDGGHTLEPAVIDIRLEPLQSKGRSLEIELDD